VGSTPQATHTASKAPEHQEGYNLFFSKAFVQNSLDYTATNYEHWQNIKANRTNMRSRSFRFRLIDFEYIVPTILQKYPDLSLSDTQVHCKPVGYDNMVFSPEEGTITLDMKWSCGVDLPVAAGSTYTFMSTNKAIKILSRHLHTKSKYRPVTTCQSTRSPSSLSTSTSTSLMTTAS